MSSIAILTKGMWLENSETLGVKVLLLCSVNIASDCLLNLISVLN